MKLQLQKSQLLLSEELVSKILEVQVNNIIVDLVSFEKHLYNLNNIVPYIEYDMIDLMLSYLECYRI